MNSSRPQSSASQKSDRGPWKILVLGDEGVGRGSLIHRYACGQLPDETEPADLREESLEVRVETADGETGYVGVWRPPASSASELDADSLADSHAGVFVFSTVDQASFDHLADWYTAFVQVCGDAPIVFAENKIDLIEESVLDREKVEAMAKKLKLRLYRTSAVADLNVHAMFQYLVQKMVKKFEDPIPQSRPETSTSNWIQEEQFEPSRKRTGGKKRVVNIHGTSKNCILM